MTSANTTATANLIEATGSGGGITLSGTGLNSTIDLTTAGSSGTITINANTGDIYIEGFLISFNVPPSILTTPMCAIQIYLGQSSFNNSTTPTDMCFINRIDNTSTNNPDRMAFPFDIYVYGWSIMTDDDAYTGTMTLRMDVYNLPTQTTSSGNRSVTTSAWAGANERAKAGTFSSPFLVTTLRSLGVQLSYSTGTNDKELNVCLWAYQSS